MRFLVILILLTKPVVGEELEVNWFMLNVSMALNENKYADVFQGLKDLDKSYADLSELKGPGIGTLCKGMKLIIEKSERNGDDMPSFVNSLKAKIGPKIKSSKYAHTLYRECRNLFELKFVCPRKDGKCPALTKQSPNNKLQNGHNLAGWLRFASQYSQQACAV